MEKKERIHYPIGAYRLSPEIINKLKKLKTATGLSYNLLFCNLLNQFNVKKFYEYREKKSDAKKVSDL